MNVLRAIFRLSFIVLFILALLLRVGWHNLWNKPDQNYILSIRSRWTRRFLLPVLGVRVHSQGPVPGFPCIIMANHRSYLDPVVICRDVPGMPVSKAEVARWPLIGTGVKHTGILFLERESRQSRHKTLLRIGEKVREGIIIILFPEGTTDVHPNTIPFRKGAFQLAAEQDLPIVPVAVEYRNPMDYWIGADTFIPHIFKRFGERKMDVYVRYGQPLSSGEASELIRKTQRWIDGQLKDIRRDFF
ncbi:MAG: 1-acyl-sn-glycerol-3-phosphate acyltransferase [Saprospirales bacterium]|nr:1-acyl-sn-glycerol-3-phosphate acyltransferase [Saprospirales bacterium]MBK8922919.1 1-acyl-sn-glycerol-3-phosphate acyltransferase [Saprospirales bacterium]